MNQWGVRTWGEPCRECGFSWALSTDEGLAVMTEVPARFRDAVGLSDGTTVGAGLGWPVTAYVCHVADNLRIFAERLVGVVRGGESRIAAYDQDELARCRGYERVAVEGALWSLERAVDDWLTAIQLARAADVVFEHPERGPYGWSDVVSSNLHDALHHEFDIRRILDSA
ncbi:MAG TPA: hypothetical protein VE466_15075 [Acidimicrobiales bacterium]|jgi:hypothetical protein|nr:hypothetical protein [Acidimicrobiales bacterium]